MATIHEIQLTWSSLADRKANSLVRKSRFCLPKVNKGKKKRSSYNCRGWCNFKKTQTRLVAILWRGEGDGPLRDLGSAIHFLWPPHWQGHRLQVWPILHPFTGCGKGKLDWAWRTERVRNCSSPKFSKTATWVPLWNSPEALIWHLWHRHNELGNDFLGGAECSLEEVSTQKMKDSRIVTMEVEAINLDKDFLEKLDPFLEFFHQGDGKWHLAYRSEVIKNN